MTLQDWSNRAVRNQAHVRRYIYIPQALAGAVLLIVGYTIGHVHFHLIAQGVRAPGMIVDHHQQYFTDRARGARSTIGFMPIVEFKAGDEVVRFEDWKGSSSAGDLQERVTVLYDPARPSDAMIDRAIANWMPWAPMFALGAFLAFVAVKGWLQSG